MLLGMVPGLAVFAAEGINVSVARLQELSVDIEFSAPATVIAANHSVISAQVPGIVSRLHADVGFVVARGGLLVELDDADANHALSMAKAELASVEAQLKLAESRLKKAQDLLTQDFVSDEELLARETDVAVLRAKRDTAAVNAAAAELNLSRTRVSAPFNGAVVDRTAQEGSLAAPGSPLFVMTQLDGSQVDSELSADFAADITPGDTAVFRSRDTEWPVELLRVSPVIDSRSRIQRARFQFTDEPAPIGSSGQVYWRSAEQQIPADFIQQRGSLLGIFIADGQKARFVELPKAQVGRPTPVGLPPDTLVIVDGRARLQDGSDLIIDAR
jgi:RND family efflux transporter MFP subunit